MGMGHYACAADVVEQTFVVEQCPTEWMAFSMALKAGETTLGDFASTAPEFESNVDLEELSEEDVQKASDILNTYKALCEAFERKTSLALFINYHVKEDRGDDVDGTFWSVEGAYVLSPAGENCGNIFF